MKQCTKCNQLKPLSDYSKHAQCKNGIHTQCKQCISEHVIARKRTKKGLTQAIYTKQISSSRRRNHPQPNYSLQQLRQFFKDNPIADSLYKAWKLSGYESNLRPSVDRMDDNLPYTLSNIQLMTWRDNYTKSSSDRRSGIDNRTCRAVNQLTFDGELVSEHRSIAEASRVSGGSKSGINLCCNGTLQTSYGFKWEYKVTA